MSKPVQATNDAPPPRKKIGLKKTSAGAAGTGTIQRIEEGGYGPGEARVKVKFNSGKSDKDVDHYENSIEVPVPAKVARSFKTGDKVRVSLEKA